MEDYAIVEVDDGTAKWAKTKNNDGPLTIEGTLKIGPDMHASQRQLRGICDTMIEEHEEKLVEHIQDNVLSRDPEIFTKVLCQDLTPHCQIYQKIAKKKNHNKA